MAESLTKLCISPEVKSDTTLEVLIMGTPDYRGVLEAVAQSQGVRTVWSSTLAHTLELSHPHRFALLIVDMEQTGEEWARLWAHMQTLGPHDRTPLLFLHKDASKGQAALRRALVVADCMSISHIAEALPAKLTMASELLRARQDADSCLTRLDETERRLQEAHDELRSFTHSISHDLRNPLHAISGIARLLIRDSSKVLDPDSVGLLEAMADSAEKMGEHIKGLLTLADQARAALHPEPIDLSQLAVQVCQHLTNMPGAQPVAWKVLPGLHAVADADMLRTLLLHLLGNAWKFSSVNAAPTVEFGCDIDSHHGPVYYVRDNGMGFDARIAKDRLFKPFQNLHTDKTLSGNGIGLALAQRIVQRHGGRIWADGQPGKGATFTFTLQPAPNGPHLDH